MTEEREHREKETEERMRNDAAADGGVTEVGSGE